MCARRAIALKLTLSMDESSMEDSGNDELVVEELEGYALEARGKVGNIKLSGKDFNIPTDGAEDQPQSRVYTYPKWLFRYVQGFIQQCGNEGFSL